MLSTLQNLTNDDFLTFAKRYWKHLEKIMDDYTAGSSPDYGWDWPTFSIVYPVPYARWKAICKDAKRRGIEKTPI